MRKPLFTRLSRGAHSNVSSGTSGLSTEGRQAEVGTGRGGEDSVCLGSGGEVASSSPFPEDAGVGRSELQWGLEEEGGMSEGPGG